MRRTAVTVCLLMAGCAPAAARAQAPVPLPPADPAPAVPAQPVQTQLTLQRAGGPRAAVLSGSRVRVRGTTGAFAAGQTVTVRFAIAGRRRAARRVELQPRAGGGGGFELSYTPRRPGTLRIGATHAATPVLGALRARARGIAVLPRRVRPRSGRASIRALQRWLRRLGYATGARGVYDARTARAVLAFRKVAGMARTTSASSGVMRALARGAGHFEIERPDHGRHIEADLSRQVIALIEGGRVRRIYPVSSGAPGTPTVRGSFRVYLKTPGTNAKGMVHAAYFVGAYATHGYASVPPYAASHGCLRVPIPDALRLFRWIRVGTRVDVYR
jgi:peptidoglycan hydrolase-like protein with peptidoglycan-binding domain